MNGRKFEVAVTRKKDSLVFCVFSVSLWLKKLEAGSWKKVAIYRAEAGKG